MVLVTIGASSCDDDFLDRSSLTSISEDNFWRNESDAFFALNGIYSTLQARQLYGGALGATQGFPGYDGLGDNSYNNWKWEGPGNFMEGTSNPDMGLYSLNWSLSYQGIARANSFIKNLNNISETLIPIQTKNELLGQAYFLRALFYFNLSVYYEDVPLILEPQTLENAFVPKNTYNEVTEQIVKDLKIAINDLPETYPQDLYGYATKGAALGLLARVQLYNKVYDGDFGVLALTEQVMQLGYALHPNYAALFSEEAEQSTEVVFSVRFLRGDNTGNGENFSSTFVAFPKGDVRPMPNLVNDYYCIDGLPITESPLYDADNKGVNRDPRANATIYFKGDIWLTDPVKEFKGNGPTKFGQRKYIKTGPDAQGNQPTAEHSQDFYVIRYADILLMRAEALAETGDLAGAMALVNVIRERVGMPNVEDVEGQGVDKSGMISIIKHERRVELALEGLRFIDLKRWGEVEEAFARAAADPVGPYNPEYLGKKSEVFPIPQSEIDVNSQLEQHIAWQ